jgi:hypothetical protein
VAGGLWLAPLVYLEHARFGAGWYGKVVSSDPERLLAWAVSKAIPRRALEVKSLPDLDMPRKGRRRLPGYHIDLWGARLALAYDPQTLAAARQRSVAVDRLEAGAGDDQHRPGGKIQHPGAGDRRG